MRNKILVISFLLLVVTNTASAQVLLELLPGGQSWSYSTISGPTWGMGRSTYFNADENFSVSKIEYYGGFSAASYSVDIFAGAGVSADAGALLETVSINWPGGAAGYIPFTIQYDFVAGNEYIISFRRTDNERPTQDVEYSWVGWGPSSSDIGVLTLLDGREGYDANSYINSHLPNFRLTLGNVVVEPLVPVPVNSSVMLMLLTLLLGIAAFRYGRHRLQY